MIFNLKYLMLPLGILICINNNYINAMEEDDEYNESYFIDQDYQNEYSNNINEEAPELTNLKNKVTNAIDYLQNEGKVILNGESLDADGVAVIIDNFLNFVDGNEELNKQYLEAVENSINESKSSIESINNDISTNYDDVIDYNDENTNAGLAYANSIENENMKLTDDIIRDLSMKILEYTGDCYPDQHLLDLYEKLNTPGKTKEEEQFFLSCYKDEKKLSKLFDNSMKSTIRDIINYLKNKISSLTCSNYEYNRILEQIEMLKDVLTRENLKQQMTRQEQKDIYDLEEKMTQETQDIQNEVVQEQSEIINSINNNVKKANPTESKEKLLEIIGMSRVFLQSKIRLKEYKPGSNEYNTAVARIEECDNFIDGLIDLTEEQYKYFKDLYNEINK